MTENEWNGDDPIEMSFHLDKLPPTEFGLAPFGFDRKLRLVGVASCRRMWRLFPSDAHRELIDLAESFADGKVTRNKVSAAHKRAADASESHQRATAGPNWQPIDGACGMAGYAAWWLGNLEKPFDVGYVLEKLYGASVNDPDDPEEEEKHQAAIIRDIFGNPFRPVAFEPSWRSSTAVAIARQMYESREFGAMPILADALQDAGCDNDDLLNHCRGDGPHVRGCWVVDLVLGKA